MKLQNPFPKNISFFLNRLFIKNTSLFILTSDDSDSNSSN